MEHKYTNQLINSASPYLLQHAHNPVNWQPWGDEVIEKAKQQNKLILISIGYAACHWCHVMEHESFEDIEVAKVMNGNFICVKVDREERPDVDNYYMTAVQLMQQQGGWPLNVIALPDGRPIWGGTYFSKDIWIKNLLAISDFYTKNSDKTEEYAESLQNGIEQTLLTGEAENTVTPDSNLVERGVNRWKQFFDMENGGRIGAPKFPMPVNLEFLLYYGFLKNDKTVLDFVENTLKKMARGGIYDQAGGGFARYSVDDKWKVPHFEKMLYDNGQLLSIYSKGYQQFKTEEFKTVVYETANFIERELLDATGAFYSSLDADSEGEEGKFYVWSESELKKIVKDDFQLFAKYFNINSNGFWEHGNYILLRDVSDNNFTKMNNVTPEQLHEKVAKWKSDLLAERSKRIRPGLDDKTLTSWNALVIKGLTDAFKVFNDDRFIKPAIKNANFIKENIIQEDGKLYHNWKNGNASVDSFLEDYSITIQAFISLFEVTGDENWLAISTKLTDYTIDNFHDEKSGLFYFSEKNKDSVLTNHFQKEDNVIPAANSVMANNLHLLYLLLGNPAYRNISEKMIFHITPQFEKYPMAYANWGNFILMKTEPFFEVAVLGSNASEMMKEMMKSFHPNVLWAFAKSQSKIPILADRYIKEKTLIYVCREGVCQLPVDSPAKALEAIKNGSFE
ncbi:MAG TPA: thioredoxin domain-containing protein [Draconibacterium sp.]|nr:thioredoxin domain-containing protein [Draconibacterium sp.]